MTGAERTGDKKYTATRGTISMIGSWGLAAVPCLAALVLAGSAWASAGQSSSDPAGGPPPPAPGDMQERRVVLVTGSTSGLGEELALRLGRTGAHVIVHGRNVERGNAVVAAIEAEGSGSARFYRADFASFDQVREFGTVLQDLGKDAEIHIYANANHAFANPSGGRYNTEAAEDAWGRVVDFFAEHLRP